MVLRMKAVGERTKAARKKKNLSQEELAEKVGISPVHLSRIENGHVVPKIDVLVELSTELNLSIDFLIWGEDISENVLLEVMLSRMKTCKNNQLYLLVEMVEMMIKYFEKEEIN